MLYARKSNRVQPIKESEVQHFLNQGFNITDAVGNIIIESVPNDVVSLKAAFKRHADEIAKLKETIKGYEAQMVEVLEANTRLTAENDALKVAAEQAEKARASKTTKAKKAKDVEVAVEATEAESNG